MSTRKSKRVAKSVDDEEAPSAAEAHTRGRSTAPRSRGRGRAQAGRANSMTPSILLHQAGQSSSAPPLVTVDSSAVPPPANYRRTDPSLSSQSASVSSGTLAPRELFPSLNPPAVSNALMAAPLPPPSSFYTPGVSGVSGVPEISGISGVPGISGVSGVSGNGGSVSSAQLSSSSAGGVPAYLRLFDRTRLPQMVPPTSSSSVDQQSVALPSSTSPLLSAQSDGADGTSTSASQSSSSTQLDVALPVPSVLVAQNEVEGAAASLVSFSSSPSVLPVPSVIGSSDQTSTLSSDPASGVSGAPERNDGSAAPLVPALDSHTLAVFGTRLTALEATVQELRRDVGLLTTPTLIQDVRDLGWAMNQLSLQVRDQKREDRAYTDQTCATTREQLQQDIQRVNQAINGVERVCTAIRQQLPGAVQGTPVAQGSQGSQDSQGAQGSLGAPHFFVQQLVSPLPPAPLGTSLPTGHLPLQATAAPSSGFSHLCHAMDPRTQIVCQNLRAICDSRRSGIHVDPGVITPQSTVCGFGGTKRNQACKLMLMTCKYPTHVDHRREKLAAILAQSANFTPELFAEYFRKANITPTCGSSTFHQSWGSGSGGGGASDGDGAGLTL